MIGALTTPERAVDELVRDWLQDADHHQIRMNEEDYPELLAQIPGPPSILYVNGNPEILHLPALAIVGSRNPTSAGSRNAFEFARHLGSAGFCIVSGLAQGIDEQAHRGALAVGAPTIAFLGHGIDRVYPASNRELAHEIASSGALVSEFPLGTHPHRSLFPQRNRLISGSSFGTLVVEAARRSGSLITARLAAEQGREVFALPGSIHNPLARGCHELIRQGAKLVETAADIVSELAPLSAHMLELTKQQSTSAATPLEGEQDYVQLRKLLSFDPIGIDELKSQSGLTIDQLSSMLLILELHGEVESMSGGRYALIA